MPLRCGDRAQHTGEGSVSCTGRAPSPLRWAEGEERAGAAGDAAHAALGG